MTIGKDEFELSGSLMSELQSYERIIEGLRMASDAAKHIAVIKEDQRWTRIAHALCVVQKAIADRARMNRPQDSEINLDLPAETMPVTAAFIRHIDGLAQAIGGLRQMATYHRMQEFWLKWVKQLEDMRSKAAGLMQARGPLVVPRR